MTSDPAAPVRQSWRRPNYIPALLLVGVLLCYPFWAYEARQARDWPVATGEVVESRVEERGARAERFHPIVVYRYSVNGRNHVSRTIQLSTDLLRFRTFEEAQAIAARYPVGARIEVRYNPANPSRGALVIDEIDIGTPLAILAALVIAGIVWFAIQSRRAREQP